MARPWRRGAANPSGAAARTAAEARAWVASARTSARSSWRSRRVAADAVDGSRHLAARAGADREGRRHHPHVVGRVASTPTTRARASATGAPCSIRPAIARSSAPSGSATSAASATSAGPTASPARRADAEPIEGVGQLPVAAASAHGRAGPGPARRPLQRGTAGRCLAGSPASGSRAGRGAARTRGRGPSPPRRPAAPSSCTTPGRAAARPGLAGARSGRSWRPVGPGEEPDAWSVGRAGRSPRRRRRPIARPSPVRATCTTRSSAELSWSRTAAMGRSRPAESTITSRRRRASSGELAWHVDSEPSWPVFIAHNMSTASGPRTSPTMMRSGRMRSALRTSCRIVVAPSAVGGGGPRLEAHDVGRGQAQLGGVLHGDDPLAVGQERAERVEHRGLARAGAAAHDHVRPGAHAPRRGARPRREGRARRGGCGALRTGGS